MQFNLKILGQIHSVIKPEDIQKVKDKITAMEIVLLKCLNFEINIELPNDYIYVYSEILYPNNEDDIRDYAIRISNDSYFTYANHLYRSYVVAIASIVIAAKFLSIPTLLCEEFKHLENMKPFAIDNLSEEEFNKRLLNYENRSQMTIKGDNSYFDSLPNLKKIHPALNYEQLVECIKMIVEFYEDDSIYTAENNLK